jgi:hypothetical protein
LKNHLQVLQVQGSGGKQFTFKTLDILYLLRSKLRNCADRGLARDFSDVQFILERWSGEIEQIKDGLDEEPLEAFAERLEPEAKTGWAKPLGPFE